MKLVLLLPLFLCGCISIVSIQSDKGEPKISWGIGSVQIERAFSDALHVEQQTIGLGTGCNTFGIGFVKSSCTMIDPKACGVAVIIPNSSTDLHQWITISNETKVQCLGKELK